MLLAWSLASVVLYESTQTTTNFTKMSKGSMQRDRHNFLHCAALLSWCNWSNYLEISGSSNVDDVAIKSGLMPKLDPFDPMQS